MSWIEGRLDKMMDKYGEIPSVFSPYDIVDYSSSTIPALTTRNCGTYGCRGGGIN